MNKVFQIGFNRCGTLSLAHHFKNKNFKVIHWDWDRGRFLQKIKNNELDGKPLLYGYEEYDCFFDLESLVYNKKEKKYEYIFPHIDSFKKLDKEYPNSKFILNIRDKNKWLKSKQKHYNNFIKKIICEKYNIEVEEINNLWEDMWNSHIPNVKKYFKNRESDLLIFNIEEDSISKLNNFFNFKCEETVLPHMNKNLKS